MKKLSLPALACALALAAGTATHAEVVRPAPGFTLAAGKTLGNGKGQPVILLIAPSPRSAAFREQVRRIEAVYQQFAARNAVFVAAFTKTAAPLQKIPASFPLAIAANGPQIAADYGFDGHFGIHVIGRDGNLDLTSAKVIPASRIMDMILNNAEQQAAQRKM